MNISPIEIAKNFFGLGASGVCSEVFYFKEQKNHLRQYDLRTLRPPFKGGFCDLFGDKTMKNGIIYSLTYLFFTFLTYLWRFSMFSTAMSKDDPNLINNMVGTVALILLINYIILILVAYCRGKAIDKKYIVIFPVIAGLFDVVLAFIPLVPTIMNITALITGVSGNKVVYVVQQSEKAK